MEGNMNHKGARSVPLMILYILPHNIGPKLGLSTRSLAFFNETQYITALLVDLDGDPEEIDVNQ